MTSSNISAIIDSPDPLDVVIIADAHDCPGISKERFRWIGRYLADNKPDRLLSIGDFLSLDSLSKYATPGSIQGH